MIEFKKVVFRNYSILYHYTVDIDTEDRITINNVAEIARDAILKITDDSRLFYEFINIFVDMDNVRGINNPRNLNYVDYEPVELFDIKENLPVSLYPKIIFYKYNSKVNERYDFTLNNIDLNDDKINIVLVTHPR